ncbi:FecR family protein [Desertivirga brevis]|uniref:FecR family protein n=1 Tax=Desertivirga brevis TaxID=2810310 RepID=UPI001A95A9E2|nr:FecR family protein [Pedobacter sp. SYSU D00873]
MIKQIWILIAKKFSGDASEEELHELEKHSSGKNASFPTNALEEIWHNTTTYGVDETRELDKRWERFEKTWKQDLSELPIESDERPAGRDFFLKNIWQSTYFRYAAVVLLTVTTGYLFWPSKGRDVITAMEAPAVGVSKLILPDGSSVWLNSGSKITFKNNSKTNCREVNLTGEAYFDVAKDARHPFIVTTPTFTIKVLGTAFNVKSYERSEQSEATLVHGKIELSLLRRPETKYILKPSQKLMVTSASTPKGRRDIKTAEASRNDEFLAVELTRVEDSRAEGIPVEILWFKNHINFDNATFGEVALMMEHKYNTKLVFKNDNLASIKFSGKFKDETLEEALKELNAIIDFKYQISKDEVLIY